MITLPMVCERSKRGNRKNDQEAITIIQVGDNGGLDQDEGWETRLSGKV